MIKTFNQIRAKCVICEDDVTSESNKIGSRYYCDDHYEKEKEKTNNKRQDKKLRDFKKAFPEEL